MRRVILILTGIVLLTATGCDIPKALGRISYAQIGGDGIAVSFYPHGGQSFDPGNDDDFLSDLLDVGSGVVPLFGLFF